MGRSTIGTIQEILKACRAPLYAVLEQIPAGQMNWKPAPESRSIGEMARHLVRVDMWFLKRLGFESTVADRKDASPAEILELVKAADVRLDEILAQCGDDAELERRVEAADAKAYESVGGILLHMGHHYLYHAAQMIYLRRAQDRNWPAPLEAWEAATCAIDRFVMKRG
jgi:uncharacterized damage-inducible protein DinB